MPTRYSLPRPLLLASTMPAYQYHRSEDSDGSDSDLSLPEINEKQDQLETAKRGFPYWIFPIVSASTWSGMLFILLIVWLLEGEPIYISMNKAQTIPYISDIGADVLMPLFVIGCVTTSVCFFLSVFTVYRNHGTMRPSEKSFGFAAMVTGGFGSVALILLTIFDTARYPTFHKGFLCLFMLGIILSAIFTTLEYRKLGQEFIERADLIISYRFKQATVILEVNLSLVMGFAILMRKHNMAAIFEWVIATIFTFYVLSFFFDLRPKARVLGEKELIRERSVRTTKVSIFSRSQNGRPISVHA